MQKYSQDIIGKSFGEWVVLSKMCNESQLAKQRYICRCNKCNKIFNANRYDIIRKQHKCCNNCRGKYVSDIRKDHNGRTKTRIYKIWQSMKSRCCYNKNIGFKNYGGRGISICNEWLGENGFENFKNWAYENGYKEELLNNGRNKWTLDRIDVNGNYEPSNCRWITVQEQLNNTRYNVYYDFEGEKLTLPQICRNKNLNINTIENRINNHKWSIEEAIYTPIGNKRTSRVYKWDRKEVEYNGKIFSKNEICSKFNITRPQIWRKLKKGLTMQEIIDSHQQLDKFLGMTKQIGGKK